MAYTATVMGIHIHLKLTNHDNGKEAEAVVHLVHNGKLGVSKPGWSDAQTVAKLALPLLPDELALLTQRVEDHEEWT